MDPRARSEVLVRALRSLADDGLRIGYVLDVFRTWELAHLAVALDALCARAEQAEDAPRQALVAIADALATADVADGIVQQLREQAAGDSLLALDRLLRQPVSPSKPSGAMPEDPNEAPVPDYGRGRPLTLGERKALARKPDRATMERLLCDPHPDVIRRLLVNPRLTEADVLRLATRRPCRPDVLTEIARSPRWMHRLQIRRAIVLNPHTPVPISTSLVGLLLRQELKLVAEATPVSPIVRALCREHLKRRPPAAPPQTEGPNETLQ